MSGLGIGIGLKLGGTRGRPGTPAPTYAERVLATSPLAYWSLNQSSGLEATDLSGNGYHAAVTGATWDAGQGPGGASALRFDGVNDSVDGFKRSGGAANGLATALSRSAFTLNTWVRIYDLSVWNDTTSYYHVWDLTGPGERVRAGKQNVVNSLRWWVDSGGGTELAVPTQPLDWRSFGVRYNANGVRAYYWDGVKVGEDAIAGTAATSWSSFVFGALNNLTFPWNGWLADLAVWGSDLGDATMLSLGRR